jgi:DNA-binding transcriptional MerR regulator
VRCVVFCDNDVVPLGPAPGIRYRIGDLSRLAGPAISTLRSWQVRYPGLLRPARTAGGHRVYDAADLAAVQAVQQLAATGHTTSSAAAYVVEQRDRGRSPLVGIDQIPPPPSASVPSDRGHTWWASTATEELQALRAAHEATRAFLRATTPGEVTAAVARFVHDVGGTVRPARERGDTAVPLDLSLGVDQPSLAHAAAGSPARRRLEALLPLLVEDARLAAGRLRAESRSHPRPQG